MTILVALATSGFWAGGHYQALSYPDLEACERDRPRIESEMTSLGYTGVFTKCVEPMT